MEYKGNARTFSGIEDDDEKLIRLINEHLEKLIEQNDVVKAEYLAYEDAKRACGGSLPSYVSPDAEESPRVVTVAGWMSVRRDAREKLERVEASHRGWV